MKKELSKHEMAVRLCEGGIVVYQGFAIAAEEIPEDECACMICQMDCVCNMEMMDLCAECDCYNRKKHYLKFAFSTL